MRFLVVSTPKHFVPPDVALASIDALQAWVEKNTSASKFEQSWSFGAFQGGGGILSVDSLDELDEVMAGFPFGPFSDIEIRPLLDLDASLQRARETIAAAMSARQGA